MAVRLGVCEGVGACVAVCEGVWLFVDVCVPVRERVRLCVLDWLALPLALGETD